MQTTNEHWKSREVARLLALVETERRYYQEMVANLPISVAVISAQAILLAANRAFRQSFSVKTDDFRKRSIEQIFPAPELPARIQSVFESGNASQTLVVSRTAPEGGEMQRFRLSLQTIRDWDEDTDLQALLVVEELAETAVSGVAVVAPDAGPSYPDPLPCVIWLAHAADRRFTSISPSAKALLDIDPADWMTNADSFSTRIDAADRAGVLTFYDSVLKTAGLHSCEFRLRRAGVWYRETILVDTTTGSLTGVITDITARRAMEEQILQSQRFEAVTQLAGRMAHDVNNPLMIVNGYAEELVMAFPSNDPRAADMREIQLAGRRIGELTGNLQSVTQKHSLQTTAVDVNAELMRVVERMRTAAGEYLQADHVPVTEPLQVFADASQLEAILLELSAALVEGGGEAAHLLLSAKPFHIDEWIRSDQPLGAGEFVEMSILNQTQPAAPLNSHLFESVLPGREPGNEAGPALARAYKTIADWGGAIRTVPGGNEIRLYLKAAAPTGARVAAATPAASADSRKAVEFARKTSILIVEDEPGIRALMRKILTREGFEVFEAASAQDALGVIRERGPFNLLITDVLMDSGMNGMQLANRVREMDAFCGILYMSGFSADTGVESGEFPPGSHFLQKPFTLGSLLRKANEVLASTPRRPSGGLAAGAHGG